MTQYDSCHFPVISGRWEIWAWLLAKPRSETTNLQLQRWRYTDKIWEFAIEIVVWPQFVQSHLSNYRFQRQKINTVVHFIYSSMELYKSNVQRRQHANTKLSLIFQQVQIIDEVYSIDLHVWRGLIESLVYVLHAFETRKFPLRNFLTYPREKQTDIA